MLEKPHLHFWLLNELPRNPRRLSNHPIVDNCRLTIRSSRARFIVSMHVLGHLYIFRQFPLHVAGRLNSGVRQLKGNSMKCPKCSSSKIEKRNRAKKGGAALGALAGAALAAKAAKEDAKDGKLAFAMVATGTVLGGITGALAGAGSGALAGAVAGGAIDDHILENYFCHECNYTFNEPAA